MVNHNIQVVTDGVVELSAAGEPNDQVAVVPYRIQVGKDVWSSEELRSIPAPSLTRAKFLAPSCAQFLRTYQRLREAEIISIHPTAVLHPLVHQARVARQLLYPRRNITIFETKAVDFGLGLLVKAASEAARDPAGFSSQEILRFLNSLQDEMIHTLVLTRDLGPYLGSGMRLALRRAWAILRAPALLTFDHRAGVFRLVAQGWGTPRRTEIWAQVLNGIPRPCAVWIRHRGFGKEIEPIRQILASLLQPVSVHLESPSSAFSPFMSQHYLEITSYPPSEVIEELRSRLRAG